MLNLVVTVLVIGLTGGIASGKSTVARQLAQLGATALDADALGHEVYRSGRPAWHQLVDAFGSEIVDADGQIDRRRLGALVFTEPAAMKRLTDIVWPLMKQEMAGRLNRLRELDTRIVVVEAAVLLEAGWQELVDEVWAVATSPQTAVSRLVQRTGASEDEARSRLAAQMNNEQRAARADVVIENNGDVEDLNRRVYAEWQKLLERAS
jgi:dephospho-CoA kinase